MCKGRCYAGSCNIYYEFFKSQTQKVERRTFFVCVSPSEIKIFLSHFKLSAQIAFSTVAVICIRTRDFNLFLASKKKFFIVSLRDTVHCTKMHRNCRKCSLRFLLLLHNTTTFFFYDCFSFFIEVTWVDISIHYFD